MLTYSEDLQAQLAHIDGLQQQIDALRPLPPEVQARIFQKFRLDWNYHSNSIEGNSLTFGETVAFIMEGVTAKGKPLKDHLDLRGHNQAIDVLLELIKVPEVELTERDIRELHSIIMAEPYEVTVETAAGPQRRLIEPGQYKTMPNHTLTGTGQTHYYATPEETPGKMHDLIEWYRLQRATLHPLVLAARFHHKFVAIHPFDDGNGRMTRLLTNLLLMKAGYPPIVVKTEEKREYYAVLSQADAGVEEPLLVFFAERLVRTLQIYLKGAKGEDIAETDDLEKRIALFKASFEKDKVIVKANKEVIKSIINDCLLMLIINLQQKCVLLDGLFFNSFSRLEIIENQGGRGRQLTITEQKLADWLENDYKADYQLKQIEFDYRWNGFKKSNNPFDIYMRLEINFNEYKYSIASNRGNKVIDKFYHEKLSQAEINYIIDTFITDTMREIERAANAQ